MSTELDLIRELYDYNSRTRAKYLDAIWKLPPRARYRDRGASFPSLVDIFMHVLDAYRQWFFMVYSGEAEPEWYPLGKRYARAEAAREVRTVDRYVRRIIRELKPGDLDRSLRIPSHPPRKIELRVLLVHMIEEELQHRGEMNALLWQAGREAPVTGFDD
ncbi:MAG TPA: DinB family protein [Thermoplasmata archaeon]|jgi:uncharacterized damage-inducible protein DinB